MIEQWRHNYGYLRPHGSLAGRPLAPDTIVWPHLSLAGYSSPALT